MFRRAPLVSDDLAGWILDSFEWVMQKNGAEKWRKTTKLVLPTKAFFSAPKGETPEIAQIIGTDIMGLIGMDSKQIRIEPLPALPDEVAHEYDKLAEVSGQYWHDPVDPLITYDPRLMRNPVALINTLTHEMMHAHLSDDVDTLPGGEAAHELSTDLHCITHGFGYFQLEAAETLGWAGYMTQPSRAFALAVFLNLTDTPSSAALSFLSPRSSKQLKRAIKDLAKFWNDDLTELKQLET